jgi:hypothetical protein
LHRRYNRVVKRVDRVQGDTDSAAAGSDTSEALLLRAAGLRRTPVRVGVLAVLARNGHNFVRSLRVGPAYAVHYPVVVLHGLCPK